VIERRWGSDHGSVLPLALCYAGLALMLIFTVVAVTSLYIDRKRLFTLADGAALAAAESFELNDVVVTEDTVCPILREERVREEVEQFITTRQTTLKDVRIVSATTLDTTSAVVTLASIWHTPVLDFLFPNGIHMEATVVSRSVFSALQR
jgi:hypothetical protein